MDAIGPLQGMAYILQKVDGSLSSPDFHMVIVSDPQPSNGVVMEEGTIMEERESRRGE